MGCRGLKFRRETDLPSIAARRKALGASAHVVLRNMASPVSQQPIVNRCVYVDPGQVHIRITHLRRWAAGRSKCSRAVNGGAQRQPGAFEDAAITSSHRTTGARRAFASEHCCFVLFRSARPAREDLRRRSTKLAYGSRQQPSTRIFMECRRCARTAPGRLPPNEVVEHPVAPGQEQFYPGLPEGGPVAARKSPDQVMAACAQLLTPVQYTSRPERAEWKTVVLLRPSRKWAFRSLRRRGHGWFRDAGRRRRSRPEWFNSATSKPAS